jgi:hypothetical protein
VDDCGPLAPSTLSSRGCACSSIASSGHGRQVAFVEVLGERPDRAFRNPLRLDEPVQAPPSTLGGAVDWVQPSVTSFVPAPTAWPGTTWISRTTASAGAPISFCIFIADKTSIGWPLAT